MERADASRPIKTILQKLNKAGVNITLNSSVGLEVVIVPCTVCTQRCAADLISTLTSMKVHCAGHKQ